MSIVGLSKSRLHSRAILRQTPPLQLVEYKDARKTSLPVSFFPSSQEIQIQRYRLRSVYAYEVEGP